MNEIYSAFKALDEICDDIVVAPVKTKSNVSTKKIIKESIEDEKPEKQETIGDLFDSQKAYSVEYYFDNAGREFTIYFESLDENGEPCDIYFDEFNKGNIKEIVCDLVFNGNYLMSIKGDSEYTFETPIEDIIAKCNDYIEEEGQDLIDEDDFADEMEDAYWGDRFDIKDEEEPIQESRGKGKGQKLDKYFKLISKYDDPYNQVDKKVFDELVKAKGEIEKFEPQSDYEKKDKKNALQQINSILGKCKDELKEDTNRGRMKFKSGKSFAKVDKSIEEGGPGSGDHRTSSQRYNDRMSRIFDGKRRCDNAQALYLKKLGVSDDEIAKLRADDKLQVKLIELGKKDDFFAHYDFETGELKEGANYRGLAYYEYKGCHIRETQSSWVAIDEHGTTLGDSKTKYGAESIIDEYLKNKKPITELTDKEQQRERDNLRKNGQGWNNGVHKKGTKEQQIREIELDCISMIDSILAYGDISLSAEEVLKDQENSRTNYLARYTKALGRERVIELIQGQLDDIESVNSDVWTDSEGVSYNSIKWKRECKNTINEQATYYGTRSLRGVDKAFVTLYYGVDKTGESPTYIFLPKEKVYIKVKKGDVGEFYKGTFMETFPQDSVEELEKVAQQIINDLGAKEISVEEFRKIENDTKDDRIQKAFRHFETSLKNESIKLKFKESLDNLPNYKVISTHSVFEDGEYYDVEPHDEFVKRMDEHTKEIFDALGEDEEWVVIKHHYRYNAPYKKCIDTLSDVVEELSLKEGCDLVEFENGNKGIVSYYNRVSGLVEFVKPATEITDSDIEDMKLYENLSPKKVLKEERFNANDPEELEKAKELLNQDEEGEIEQIVDINAETEDDLKDTYVGNYILKCSTCHTLMYKSPEECIKDENNETEDVYNVEEECTHCGAIGGFELVGKVAPVEEDSDDEEIPNDEFEEDEIENSNIEDENTESNENEENKEEDDEEKDTMKVEESLLTDINEIAFDDVVNQYVNAIYENVKDYKTVDGQITDKGLVLEGVITFNSGKTKNTKFVFEHKETTASGKLRLVGLNETFVKNKRAFTLLGNVSENTLIAESLVYNYKVGDKQIKGRTKYISN